MVSKKRSAKTETATEEPVILAIKGFNKDLTCTPNGVSFQYEVGKTYKVEGAVKACNTGFHAVEGHPLDVLGYYAPATSVFHDVELRGPFSRDGADSKIASAEITIKAEIKLPELISRAVKYVFDRVTYVEGGQATGDQGAASATGTRGAASATGTRGAASATGTRGAASATGYQGAASATGYQGAASATGDQGAASATGYQGAASATGTRGAASATGTRGRVMGKDGNALFLVERVDNWGADNHGEIIAVWAGIVGKDGVKADTWYTLKGGSLVEV